jgi:2-polyprenyl-3-methyl-5-hydroxy-6-metoxy-1,4-benzoquinol methylase
MTHPPRDTEHPGEHPLVTLEPATLEEHCLHLMNLHAYGELAGRVAGKRVLDIGCNLGYGTNLLAEKAPDVTGVDLSAAAIAEAERRYARPGLAFRCIDGTRLPWPDASFDAVTSLQVIEHIDAVGDFLSEVRRVLRPGGLVFLTTPNAAIRLDPGMPPWNPYHVREYTAEALRRELEPYFEDVTILGHFATEALYNVERRRVDVSRRRALDARRPAKRMRGRLRRLARAVLPASVYGALAARGGPSTPITPEEARRFGVQDLHYAPDRLPEALDFLASGRRPG